MTFTEKLKLATNKNNSLVCVGLDPDLKRLPKQFSRNNDGILAFNKAIIDATADLVCAFKPQIAYFAAFSAEKALEESIAYIKNNYPEVPVILDAKRGDIGSTANHYAKEAFERYNADALTVNPYMGFDTIEPYLDYTDRGTIVLCHTSNPGAGEIQEKEISYDDKKVSLYEYIAHQAKKHFQAGKDISLVVGATVPEELKKVRSIVDDMPLLVPGLGAQGGDLPSTVKSGICAQKESLILNSSRAIIFASEGNDFSDAAHKACLAMKNEINQFR